MNGEKTQAVEPLGGVVNQHLTDLAGGCRWAELPEQLRVVEYIRIDLLTDYCTVCLDCEKELSEREILVEQKIEAW